MELQEALAYINKASAQFRDWNHKVEVGDRYFDNRDDIIKTGAAAIDAVNSYFKKIGENPLRSADNRIACNWHEILTVQKVAYGLTYAPTIAIDSDEKLTDAVNDVLGEDFVQTLARLGMYATNAGTSWLQYWIDSNGEFKTAAHKANHCAVFYDPMDIDQNIKVIVRQYFLYDEENNKVTHYEVWDDKEVLFINGNTSRLENVKMNGIEVDRMKNPFGAVPFIEFPNNAKKSSDLIKYKALIDSFDKIVSGFANDLDDIQEIILVLRDLDGEKESAIWVPKRDADGNVMTDEDGEEILEKMIKPVNILQQIKTQKYVTTTETGGVDKITLDIPTEARDAALTLLQKQIYIAGMGVDPNPERTGQATGAYVDHMYHLLELKFGLMETEFRVALNKLVRAILRYKGVTQRKKIVQSWTRNKPKDANEIVNRLNSTPNTVISDYTKRRLHPDIDDPDIEDKRVKQEQKELMNNTLDNFGNEE